MKFILAVLLTSFCLIELAHLNYHAQQGVQPSNIDKNFWTLISYKQHWSIPHRGYHNCWSSRSLRSLLYTQCHAVLYCAPLIAPGERAKRAGTVSYIDTNTYQYQNICLAVERHFNKCTPSVAIGATLCHTVCMTQRQRLKDVTFTINDKPMSNLLWCNKVPKGKRNKPAKINGVQHHEVSDAVEHSYYVPVQ